jgi:cytochrome c5
VNKNFVLIVIAIAVLAQAASAADINPRVGKKLFDRVCRTCHSEGARAGELNPSSKTMEEWQQLIKQNKHRCDPKVLRNLNYKDREALVAFLKRYASDYDY